MRFKTPAEKVAGRQSENQIVLDQSSSECLTRTLGHDKRIYFMNAGEV